MDIFDKALSVVAQLYLAEKISYQDWLLFWECNTPKKLYNWFDFVKETTPIRWQGWKELKLMP